MRLCCGWMGLAPCSLWKSGWYTLQHFWLRPFTKLKLLELKWIGISQKLYVCETVLLLCSTLKMCVKKLCKKNHGEWSVTTVRKAINMSSDECSCSLFGNSGSFFPLAERCSELGCSLAMICSKVKDSSEVKWFSIPAWFLNYLINPLYWNMLHRQWVQDGGRMKVAVTIIFYLLLY